MPLSCPIHSCNFSMLLYNNYIWKAATIRNLKDKDFWICRKRFFGNKNACCFDWLWPQRLEDSRCFLQKRGQWYLWCHCRRGIRSRASGGRKGGFLLRYIQLFRRDDINLVVSACYSNEHYAVALDLLNHGHNVLNEKLLCKTPQLAQGRIDAA